MRITGVVQARMGSSRLPGKVLLPLGGNTVLGRLVRAVRESGAVDTLVVATTADRSDDPVVTECARLAVPVYRGQTDDVLARFIGALDAYPGDAVMRFCADTPLLDPEIPALAARVFRAVPGLDYLNTCLPPTLPLGMDAEIINAGTLRRLDGLADGAHRAHVTSYVYSNPERFRILGLTQPPPSPTRLRLTLDTPQDWALVRAVVDHFGDSTVPMAKLVEWLDKHPHIRDLNSSVRQKAMEQA